MPRALTEKEKCTQCQRLLDKGKDAVISHGLRKVSVDDIVRAAGMAKGTFYQHFSSKEQYLLALIEKLHKDTFTQAQTLISHAVEGNKLRENTKMLLQKLFSMPEMCFFIENENDLIALFETLPNQDLQSFKQMEAGLFEGILRIGGIDTAKVKPGVVHNYLHTLYLMMGSDLMTHDDLPETVDLITDSLISYIFGGVV